MRPDPRSKSLPLPQPGGLSQIIDGLAALVEQDIKVAVFDPELFGWADAGLRTEAVAA